MTFDFHGKVVLVTGAAAGLGFACAKAFTDAGATVVMTDIVQESLDKAVEELGRSVPLGRIAEPEDIADVVLFLASDAARYMCGALVEVNGGKPVA